MNGHPLLVLPPPSIGPLQPNPGRLIEGINLPTRRRQDERLTPKFDVLQRQAVALAPTPGAAAPEEVVVLETVGSVSDFIEVVHRLQGMEWLGEWDEDEIAPDADFFNTKYLTKAVPTRLYLIMSNQRAMQELISLWNRYKAGHKLAIGLGKWNQLFDHLKDVRVWGVKDRLHETGVWEHWQDALQHAGNERIRCEVELWHRASRDAQARASTSFKQALAEQNGIVVQECQLDEIGYHALLIELPRASVEAICNNAEPQMLKSSEVMFFRPTGQSVSVVPPEPGRDFALAVPEQMPTGDPIVALLDGLPLENHVLLQGRLRVDDPDNWAATYPARYRHHGTYMASLLCHGELDAARLPLSRPIYVRPIIKFDPLDFHEPKREIMPADVLAVDLVRRAVHRMLRGEAGEQPTAPTVCVINFSVADPCHPFDSFVSAWAKLLDWLSWEYNVLFVVSAGNYPTNIELDMPRADLAGLNPADLQKATLKAIVGEVRQRRLLSPAEAVNVLTVGASHSDGSTIPALGNRIDPLQPVPLPSPVNALGHGFRASIKPELLMPGGRQLYSEKMGTTHSNATLVAHHGSAEPGHKVASPGTTDGEITQSRHVRGTSGATALATRHISEVHDRLEALNVAGAGISGEHIPVLLKALAAHGAGWNQDYEVLDSVLRDGAHRTTFKKLATRLLGYGAVECERTLGCTAQRATLVGVGTLENGQVNDFAIPLPPSLSAVKVKRRLTITLAWFTPINPRHRSYRRAALWFEPPQEPLAVKRSDCDWNAVTRGTLQHEVLDGNKATPYLDGATMTVRVCCKADAGELTVPIRYGLAVTLEVAEGIEIPIYEEVRVRLRQMVPVEARTRA